MRCRCLNDREYQQQIRDAIGIEVGLIIQFGEFDQVEDHNESALQDWISMSGAATFPPCEVIRPWRPKRRLRQCIGRLLEDLLFI